MPESQTPENGTETVEETTQTPAADETPKTQEETTTQQTTIQTATTNDVDYKEKFAESTRENQILAAKLKESESRRETPSDPTEAELRTAFPTFDYMTDTEKDIAKRQLRAERKADAALQRQQERDKQEQWDRELEIAITSNSSLEGKERAFKEFANKPSHKGAPISVLVDAFLHKNGSVQQPKREPAPGLETGTGGPREPAKPKTLSGEELKQLRETNYKAYQEYIKTHDIEV